VAAMGLGSVSAQTFITGEVIEMIQLLSFNEILF
jgi:hypothetical protein